MIVGAVAVLTIGACAMAASAVRPEDPVAVADEVVAALPEATAQTGQAAASQAQSGDVVDPRAVAEDARTALDAASGTEDVNLFNSVTGIARTLSSDEISDVEGAIAAYHDAGYEVGFVMYDLTTHEGVGVQRRSMVLLCQHGQGTVRGFRVAGYGGRRPSLS